jgi:hypothetical protein
MSLLSLLYALTQCSGNLIGGEVRRHQFANLYRNPNQFGLELGAGRLILGLFQLTLQGLLQLVQALHFLLLLIGKLLDPFGDPRGSPSVNGVSPFNTHAMKLVLPF